MVIKKIFTYSDFSAAAATNALAGFILPANTVMEWCKIKHSTPFSGGSISSYTVSVGITGDLARFATAFDVFQAVGDTAKQNSFCFNEDGSVTVRVTATASHNLDTATAGSVTIWLKYKRAD
jgi:hypothetical protein